jgi:hypothetical protein
MTTAGAGALAALVLCMTADEWSTRQALRAGARETLIARAPVRLALKVGVSIGWGKKQGKSDGVRWGFPTAYCAAAAWNLREARVMEARKR